MTTNVWLEQEWQDHHYRLAMRTIETTFDRRSVQIFARLLAGVSVVGGGWSDGAQRQQHHAQDVG